MFCEVNDLLATELNKSRYFTNLEPDPKLNWLCLDDPDAIYEPEGEAYPEGDDEADITLDNNVTPTTATRWECVLISDGRSI